MSEQSEGSVSKGNGIGLIVGVLGILAAVGAFVYAMTKTNGLKEELRKDREAKAAAIKGASDKTEEGMKSLSQKADADLKAASDKTNERFEQHEKAMVSGTKGLSDRAFSAESRIDVLEKPGRTRKDVEEHPEKYLSVKSVAIFNPGFINDYAALSKMELENTSDADIIWIELKVTYFKGDREVGSKTFILGDAGIRNPEKAVLPKKSTVKAGKSASGGYQEEKFDIYLHPDASQISGKADRGAVQILRVKSLE